MSTFTGPLPRYLIGRFIKNVLVSPVTFDGNLFTINTGTDLGTGATFAGMTLQLEAETEQAVPTNGGTDNQVITLDSMQIVVTELIPDTGISALLNLYLGFDFFRVSASVQPPSASTPTAVFAALLTRKSCDTDYERGPNMMKLTGVTCGVAPFYGNGAPPF